MTELMNPTTNPTLLKMLTAKRQVLKHTTMVFDVLLSNYVLKHIYLFNNLHSTSSETCTVPLRNSTTSSGYA